MSANEQMAAAASLGFVPYTRPTGTDTAEPLKIGVLISGSGTNLQALIDLIAAGKLNASIELVVSSRPSAKGLQRAERAGIQTLTLSKDVYADPIAADEIIAHELLERGCEYVVTAGYMRMVHTPLLAAFPNRVVNLHPALLPHHRSSKRQASHRKQSSALSGSRSALESPRTGSGRPYAAALSSAVCFPPLP